MKRFKLLNNIFGWVAFAIAATTYLLTVEPTGSFWDCGEFISTAYKLDVGHPPGAPFFMLTGKFFTLFASGPSQVALMINSMSAILSAFTILFLFWTITHIARKVIIKNETDYTTGNIIAVLGAGLVGALAYTFSDTFWFSAVEGEVYAYSSFFTAIVFWLILKWENVADEKSSDRWLIVIAYLMGLSIGVHLLNLLTIPALVLVYYFKKYTPSVKGVLWAMVAAVAILVFVLYGLIPGFVEVGSWFELLFVNKLGFSFNTGLFVYIIITIAALIWAIYESYTAKSYVRMAVSFVFGISIIGIPFIRTNIFIGIVIILAMIAFFYFKKEKVSARWLNTIMVMATVMLIGYSSYSVIVIRSAANPPMDQNSPDNIFSLKYYLNREQYGDNPLLYGPVYNAPVKYRVEGNMCVVDTEEGKPSYAPKPKTSPDEKDEYIITGYKTEYKMNEKFNMLFPRMYYSPGLTPRHIDAYKAWGDVKGEKVKYDACGRTMTEVKPTFVENIRFFFNYQIGFMYWRYFMWNFSGRQNDIQGQGEIENGNWLTGFKFIDNIRLGDQDSLPTLMKENKGRNRYYMLPFLLGVIGIFFLLGSGKEGKHGFWITCLLFLLTGLAIVLYLNQSPLQVRERDYAYAGSFYAYCIWIGLGVLGVIKALHKFLPRSAGAVLATVFCLGVPVLMATENWDDHDRSGRTMARDFGRNYLMSCKPNAIIFSNGDNDTFPLWYNQEVEGERTDVRVCNLSYLQTDWYIDQMKRGYYESAPLPISWQQKDYMAGKNEVVMVEEQIKKPIDVKKVYNFLLDDKHNGEGYIPTKQLYIPIDRQEVIDSKVLPAERESEIISQIDINLNRRLTKSELMVIEMLNENKWKRPIYFAVTVGDDYYLGLENHFELTGLTYQVLPVQSEGGASVNTAEMYDNMMNKYRYGNVSSPKTYIDENAMRMCRTHRMMFVRLIEALINENDTVRAKAALDYCEEVLPGTKVPHDDYFAAMLADFYYQLNEPEKGDVIAENVIKNSVESLDWYFGLSLSNQRSVAREVSYKLGYLNFVLKSASEMGREDLFNKYYPQYAAYAKKVNVK